MTTSVLPGAECAENHGDCHKVWSPLEAIRKFLYSFNKLWPGIPFEPG